jgi:hypothetical protein
MIRYIWDRISEISREEESGQAMTEAVIALPVQLMIIAGIMQFALYNTAVIVVNHAAYAAARAALISDESPSGTKILSERAARFICSSIAGTSDVTVGPYIDFPGPNGTLRLNRSQAATKKTQVKIVYEKEGRGQAIQAIVSHEFELVIPVVRYFFTDKKVGVTPHITIKEDCILPCPWRRK